MGRRGLRYELWQASSMRRVWALMRRHPAVRFWRYEMGLYRDFVRWVRGRVVVPDGATVLPHQPGRLQMVGSLPR